jgi:hypothetical protein
LSDCNDVVRCMNCRVGRIRRSTLSGMNLMTSSIEELELRGERGNLVRMDVDYGRLRILVVGVATC